MAVSESGTKRKMSLLEALKEESKSQQWGVLNNPDTPQSLEQKDLSPLHITTNNRRLHLEMEGGVG